MSDVTGESILIAVREEGFSSYVFFEYVCYVYLYMTSSMYVYLYFIIFVMFLLFSVCIRMM